MKLSLLIPVYKGGDYWRECWESIKKNLDFFDGVYISFNYSELQEKDFAIIQDCHSDKIHWIRQDRMLVAAEHGRCLDRWLRGFQLSGHIFHLCHDDILCREGLEELSKFELTEEDAVFGPFHFFDDQGILKEMTVREFHRADGQPLSGAFFASLQEQRNPTYSISGLILPAGIFQKPYLPWQDFIYGYRSELLHLCNPYVKRVFQGFSPTVKIRLHAGAEGNVQNPAFQQHDTMLYLLVSFAAYSDSRQRMMIARSVGYVIGRNFPRGLRYFLGLQFKLRKAGFYYPAGWKIYGYLGALLFQKAGNLFKRILRSR